jgi:hypothetical protein
MEDPRTAVRRIFLNFGETTIFVSLADKVFVACPPGIGSCRQKQKSSELSLAALWLVPSPEYFAKIKPPITG